MRREYDFSGGVRGKYAERYRQQLTAVVEREGDGFVSPFLKIELPDLSLLKKNNKGVFPFSGVMASIDGSRVVRGHGDPAMPVWGEVFRKELEPQKYHELTFLLKVKIIAEYISTLQR